MSVGDVDIDCTKLRTIREVAGGGYCDDDDECVDTVCIRALVHWRVLTVPPCMLALILCALLWIPTHTRHNSFADPQTRPRPFATSLSPAFTAVTLRNLRDVSLPRCPTHQS